MWRSCRSGIYRTLVGAVLGVGLSPMVASATTSERAVTPATPICTMAKLVIWLNTQGSGAAGSTYYNLEFTNFGGTCVLQGYPGVSAVNLSGHQIGAAATRDRVIAARPITLTRGMSAKAIVQIADTTNYPASFCRVTGAAGIRVFAPGAATSKIVPFPFSACLASGETYLHIEAAEPQGA